MNGDGPADPWAHLDLWDRQPGEGPTPYRQFVAYRDQGPQRTVKKVAEDLKRGPAYMAQVAWANRWVERALAWDVEQDKAVRARIVQQRADMVETHVAIARRMLQTVVGRLRDIDPSTLSARDLVYWVDVAVKVERLALGEPTENHGHQASKHQGLMSEEEAVARLQEIRDEADARLSRAAAGPVDDGAAGR